MQKRRDILKVSEINKKKRKILKTRFVFAFIIFIFLVVILSLLSRNKNINIDNIEVLGNNIIDKTEILNVVENDLNGRYLFLFPKRNSLIYQKGRIKNDLLEKLKRISEVKIDLKKWRTLQIEIKERPNEYLWCGDESSIGSNFENNCYFIDGDGYIFDKAPYFSGDVFFRFYGVGDLKDINSPIGDNLFPQEDFKKLVSFRNSLLDMGIESSNLLIKSSGDYELILDYFYTNPEPPKIIFNRQNDLLKIIDNLDSALKNEPLLTKFKNDISKLLYLDLRFDNKVYYKFSDGK